MERHTICHAVTDDFERRVRWMHCWYRDRPQHRIVLKFHGLSELAEQRALKWCKARLAMGAPN